MSMTWSVSPILFASDWLTVRWFNLFWLFELVFGFWLLSRQIRRGGGEESEAADLAVHVWLGLTFGARLGEALFYNLDELLADPTWLLRFAAGGVSSHGAVVGSALAVWVYARRRSQPWLDVTDRLTFSFAAAAITHRIANLFNSEIVGQPTGGAWGVRFPYYDTDGDAPLRHPSQLYEAAMGAAVLGVLLAANRGWGGERRPRGALTGLALISYFGGRFAVELVKAPQPGETGDAALNLGQQLSLPLIVFGALVLGHALRRRAPAGWCLLEGAPPGGDGAPAGTQAQG